MKNNSLSLWKKSATQVIELLKNNDINFEEVIRSAISRIEEVNPAINAIPTLCLERAYKNIKKLQNPRGLYGLPVFIKDLTDVQGVRTTYGSKIYRNHIPDTSDILVQKIEHNNGIILGKTNTPEFGAGSNTFNDIFGATKNPWNMELTSGGSSGGSAAALASGMAWLATGSDLGGSLRNPASWCGVIGLRPTPGLVAHGPSKLMYESLSVDGPMARNIDDLAVFLDNIKGYDIRDPLSRNANNFSYSNSLNKPLLNKRVAYTSDFGFLPCHKEIREMMEKTVATIKNIGFCVSKNYPDIRNSEKTFQTLRASLLAFNYSHLLEKNAKNIKKDLVWNIKKGMALSINDINECEKNKKEIYLNTLNFFKDYDFLIAPSSMVPPFDINIKWIKEVEGKKFDNYVSWLMTAACISLTGCPAIALSTGFSKKNAPIGIQIIAPPFQESKLLKIAKIIEKNFSISKLIPININNTQHD